MYRIKSFLYIAFLLFQTIVIAQEFEFTAKASKTTLGVNQRVKVEFTMNQNGADNFRAPDFRGFRVIAGPSTSVSQSWINGKTSYSQSYIYFLEPVSKGTFTLGSAYVTFQGKDIRSNPLTFTITDEIKEPKNPNDPTNTAKENIFLVAHISKENPYLGEGIFVEYRLYFTDKIQFYNPQFGDVPKYEGFWNQEIPISSYEMQQGTYKGESLYYYTLKKTVLIPQKTGRLKINPMDMDVIVEVPTGKYDFFGYPLFQKVPQHYTSGTREIAVKGLPESGKPENFTGAVGDFKFNVQSNKYSLGANESAKIDVSVSGTGNLKLFDLPSIKAPAELEMYAPERVENVNTSLSGLSGAITDSYSIVPNYKGKYPVPAVSFSYFNPNDGKYYTLSSDEIVLDVTEGNLKDDVTDETYIRKSIPKNGKDFRYIATESQFKPITDKDFYGSLLNYTLVALPFLAIPLFIAMGAKRNQRLADVVGNKKREADKLAKKYLSEAKKQLGHKELFYEALEKALHNFLKSKLNIETIDFSQEKISKLLQENSVSETGIQNFIEVLNDCTFARFTPLEKGAMETELQKAAKVIQHVNSELQKA